MNSDDGDSIGRNPIQSRFKVEGDNLTDDEGRKSIASTTYERKVVHVLFSKTTQ